MAVAPANIDLLTVSESKKKQKKQIKIAMEALAERAYPLLLDVEVVSANMFEKCTSISSLQEGHSGCTLVLPQVHIQ